MNRSLRPGNIGVLVPVAAGLAVALASCGHEPRIRQLRNAFDNELARGNLSSATQLERQVVEVATRDHGAEDPATVRLRADLATRYGWFLQTDRALAMASDDLAKLEARYGRDDVRTFPPRFAIAWTLVAARRWQEAESAADHIAAICHRAAPPDERLRRCRFDIDDLYMAAGNSRQANVEFVRTQAEGILRDDPKGVLPALTLMGRRHAELGLLPEARWYLRRCVSEARSRQPSAAGARRAWSDPSGDIRIDVVDSAHAFDSQAPRCVDDLIEIEKATGQSQETAALTHWRDGLWAKGPNLEDELKERVRLTDSAWHDDALTAWDLDTLAWYYRGKGRPGDAIAAWDDADLRLERLRSASGRHPSAASAWRHADVLLGRAAALEESGAWRQAGDDYRRAFAIVDAEMHPAHAWRLQSLAGLARVRERTGDATEAQQTWQRYLEIAAEMRGRDHADFAVGLEGLASTREAAGDPGQTRSLREQARRIRAAYLRRMNAALHLPLPSPLRSPPSPATDPPTETPAALP